MENNLNLLNEELKWSPNDFETFLVNLDDEFLSNLFKLTSKTDNTSLIRLNKVLEISSSTEEEKNERRKAIEKLIKEREKIRISNISKYLIEKSSYKFLKEGKVDYQKVLEWIAENMGIEKEKTNDASTIKLEEMITLKNYDLMLDGMSSTQKDNYIEDISKIININKDKLSNVALNGAVVLGALSTTINVSGFAAYTTMSSIIFSAANVLGLTVPFAGYIGASTFLSIFSGPVGWTVIGIFFLVGLSQKSKKGYNSLALMITSIYLIKLKILEDKETK